METTTAALLTASKLSKRFGATCALHSADMTVRAGQVHALMGENGAGKSTFVKMLVGALQPDSGSIELMGTPVAFRSVRDAIAAGIIPVYQHSTLFPDMTVEQNLHAFDLARQNAVWRHAPSVSLRTYLDTAERIGVRARPDQLVSQLTLAERQLLEITRGVARQCKLLLLDEPTAALNASEAERLFSVIADLRRDGKGIIFISHKLNEITRICDVVTVLRDGHTVIAAAPANALSHREIVEAMVGPVAHRTARMLPPVGPVRLQVSALECTNWFKNISLTVGRGEIIGIAGLIGSGANEVGEAIGGARAPSAGSIQVDGGEITDTSRRKFKDAGIGIVPADRTADGIFPGLSCAINASSSAYSSIAVGPFLSSRSEIAASTNLFDQLRVKPRDPGADIGALSGGNQQKLLIIRNLLLPDLKVLVVLEPTRGVDVHARDAIHDAILAAASRGISVVIASSDIEEVLALSHRICVMREGRLASTFPRGTNPAEILACISGDTFATSEADHAHI